MPPNYSQTAPSPQQAENVSRPTAPAIAALLRPLPWWPALMIAVCVASSLVALGYALHGKPLAEKAAIALLMPIGAVWTLTTGRLLHLLYRRRLGSGKILLAFWSLLAACATAPLPEALNRSLERSVETYNPTREPALDVAIVLGGGTTQGDWRAQAGQAGDRVLMAAELFHLGYARQLVTTGQATAGVSRTTTDPSDQTIEIWTSLGIPRTAILKLGGRNTSEEVAQIKAAWPQLAGRRVGLLTSAKHLPRAIRLAAAHELDLIPVAAEVTSMQGPWTLLDFIPSASNLASLASSQHEIMAYLVKR